MSALYLEALGGVAASLSDPDGAAWVVQRRAGNPGWVDTIRPLLFGPVGTALWPVEGVPSNARERRYRDRQLRTSPLFPPPPA